MNVAARRTIVELRLILKTTFRRAADSCTGRATALPGETLGISLLGALAVVAAMLPRSSA